MEIQVLYFAVFRERIGKDRETIDLPEGSDVAGAIAVLAALHKPVRALAGRFQVAVNRAVVSPHTVLEDGDELALIPPVAGGGDAPGQAGRHARIVEGPPSLERCIAAVASPAAGGVVTFTGLVREQSRGRQVERLEYEAYVEMAEELLRELCAEVEAEHPPCRTAVEHRIGELGVGDLVVTIAVAAPHREEAFAGCRALIDRLKERVPIWKKETTADGAEWVGLGP